MTSVIVILSIALLVSISLNIFMLWYGRAILEDFYYMSDNLGSLIEQIIIFSEHLKSVYELEMFYGDDTLKSLMDHARELSEKLEDLDLVLNEQGDEVAEIAEETQKEN